MTVYDGVAGLDQPALDDFVSAAYHAAHDAVLVGNHPLTPPAFGIASFDWDVASVPVLTLEPSAVVRERALAALARSGVGTDAEHEAVADAHAKASLGLAVEHLTVGVRYTDPAAPVTHIDASVRAGIELTVVDGGVLTPVLTSLVIDVPADPQLAEIVNFGLGKALVDVINQTFLTPIRIPPLTLGALAVAPPAVITGSGRLLVTSAVLPALPDPAPVQGAWPAHTAFAAVDAAVVNALVNQQLAGSPLEGDWQTTISFGIGTLTIKAHWSATVGAVDLVVVPGQDGLLRGSATVTGTAHLWSSLFSVTAAVSAAPVARVRVSITPENKLVAALEALESLTPIQLDLHNVAPFIDGILSAITNAFGQQIAAAISSAVAALPAQPIWAIPQIPITIGDDRIVLTLTGTDVTTIADPDGRALIGLTGGASVQVGPAAPQAEPIAVPHSALVDA